MITAAIGSVATADTFERAIRVLLPALRGYARRLTLDPTQSEDLVQETLLRAWTARHRFIADTNFRAWLFRIAFNCFVSGLRKSRRVVQLSPVMADIGLRAPAMQEEGLMQRDFALALAALSRDQADALALINDERIPYEEAAERLGIPLGTMKSRTARARAAVTKFLDGDTARPTTVRVSNSKRLPQFRSVSRPLRIKLQNRQAAWTASGRDRSAEHEQRSS